jgi:tRNA(Ile)-lysidine synthetase-like protein
MRIRNWRAGDRFWPAHTKAPKKIKELLSESHVAGGERKLWPVVIHENAVVWMRGFSVATEFGWERGNEAILIRETSLA